LGAGNLIGDNLKNHSHLQNVPVLMLVRALGLGGTERQLTELAKHLDPLRFRAHVGCFHSDGMRGDELRQAGVPVVRFPVRSFASPSAVYGAFALRKYLQKNRIRVVHAFDVPMNLFAVPAARFFGTEVVVASQRAYRDLVGPAYRLLLSLCDRLAATTIVNCRAIEEHLVNDYHVRRDKIQLCYNGIDIAEFSPDGRSRRNPIVIGGVYALRPEKSIETLIDAFALVRAGRPQIRLHITGSGSAEKSLRERIAALGIGESVLLNPACADVARRMREIDIFVLPSVSEALSNSLMEAMASGCAVTASCVGGNPELVAEGETGLLFKPGDVAGLARNLERLVDDEKLRERLAAQGTEFIRTRFSIPAAAARMEEIYTALVAKSG